MSGNQVRLANGEIWTWRQFAQHYLDHPPGAAPSPVILDRNWYMDEGPGRYYRPGMFDIVQSTASRNDLAPGTYDLWQLAPNGGKDSSVKALISHYDKDPSSEDHWTRKYVFGNESARISGRVTVNPDGSKTFHNVEIRPYDTDFNFQSGKTENKVLEAMRWAGGLLTDPFSRGASYDMGFPAKGRGRVYYPFSDSQLNVAEQDAKGNPDSAVHGQLPSVASATPAFLDQQQQYLDQTQSLSPNDSGWPRLGPPHAKFGGRRHFAMDRRASRCKFGKSHPARVTGF